MMTDKEAQAFMQKVDSSAPFWQELHSEDRPTMKIQGRGRTPMLVQSHDYQA